MSIPARIYFNKILVYVIGGIIYVSARVLARMRGPRLLLTLASALPVDAVLVSAYNPLLQ